MKTSVTDQKPKVVHFVLRLPPELHKKLALQAKEQERSLHGHLLYLLKQGESQGIHASH